MEERQAAPRRMVQRVVASKTGFKVSMRVDERILETAELLKRIPLDRSTIWRMVRDGRFPAPIQLTTSRIGWRLSSILNWLSERETNPVEARRYFNTDKNNSGITNGTETGME
jgi:prophage regulatory protein